MRTLAILLVAVSPALAQDEGGAALFYKGFWLEQAEGKLDEAAALYGKLLADKPDAAEAPRALLGLVRIKVAKGEDASELVAELERRYPAAKEEIAGAKRVAVREEFDAEHRKGDSPVTEKLRSLLSQGVWTDADRLFLVDLGAVAHPMLARLLRSSSDGWVVRGAEVLVEQRTPEAYAVLAAALLDDTALFRSTIVEQLRGREVPVGVVDTLGKLYARSAPRLRAAIVETVVSLAGGERRDVAFALLTRALADADETVRNAALAAIGYQEATDAYLDALLRAVESGITAEPSYVAPNLLRFADRAAFRDRIEKIVEARNLQADAVPGSLPEEGAVMLARILVRKQGKGSPPPSTLVNRAALASPRAAALLLMAAIETGEDRFAKFGLRIEFVRKHLGAEADKVRAAAIAAAEGIGEERRPNADREVLDAVGVTEQDFPSIVEGLRRRGDKPFPAALLRKEVLWALGPAKAGALVEFCRSEQDVQGLLRGGADFVHADDAGVDFFRQVVPKAGPRCAVDLHALLARPQLIALVAERLVAAEGPEWGWGVDLRSTGSGWFTTLGNSHIYLSHDQVAQKCPGPYLWLAILEAGAEGQLGAKLVRHVGDKRPEIAIAAAAAAAAEKSEAGTAALRLALDSATPAARAIALEALTRRVADGPSLVREFARRANLADFDRNAVARAVGRGPAYATLAAELIRLGTWPDLWHVYQQIAPKECVELALAEAVGERDGDHRYGAVRVLTEVEEPRRIEVFRKVLKGTDRPAILEVLNAVRDQYLVELGEETLAQLRNPDPGIRATATEAIDKLKFYAEAKKAFEK